MSGAGSAGPLVAQFIPREVYIDHRPLVYINVG